MDSARNTSSGIVAGPPYKERSRIRVNAGEVSGRRFDLKIVMGMSAKVAERDVADNECWILRA